MDKQVGKRVVDQGITLHDDKAENVPDDTSKTKRSRIHSSIQMQELLLEKTDNNIVEGLCALCRNVLNTWDMVKEAPYVTVVNEQSTLQVGMRGGTIWSDSFVTRDHHWNVVSLEDSAGRGCKLCSLLRQALAYEGYEPPSYFHTGIGHKVRQSHGYKELCLYKKSEKDHDFCWAAEIHFAHEWIQPEKPVGQFEIIDGRNYQPTPYRNSVYLLPIKDLEPLRYQTVMPRDATLRKIIDMVANWFGRCQKDHPQCRRDIVTFPSRLIKIDSNCEHLVLSTSLGEYARYMTLSHCWGNLDILRLVKNNFLALQKEIPHESLCRTFQEAIFLTRSLGFEYLWIDSLCIIQDDPADWRREAATMSSVYTYSALNIAATSAEDGSQGCFRKSDPGYVACHTVPTNPKRETGRTAVTCINSGFYTHNVLNTPLGRRAWVVQERLLAPRTIHLGKNQLFWTCQEQIASSDFPDYLPTHLLRQGDQPDFSRDLDWRLIVSQYSGCNLTRSSDKLVAISGLARKISEKASEVYLAGLWLGSLHTDLCWRVEKLETQTRPTPDTYRAPSWSWASLDVTVRFSAQRDLKWRPLMIVVRTEIELIADDPYGELKSASLWVTSNFFASIIILSHKRRNANFQKFGESSVPMIVTWDVAEDIERRCYFLPVLQNIKSDGIHGLVLAATGKEQGQYCRIGHFQSIVEGWPYDKLESAADDPECRAEPKDFLRDFRDGDGALMGKVINLI